MTTFTYRPQSATKVDEPINLRINKQSKQGRHTQESIHQSKREGHLQNKDTGGAHNSSTKS